MADKEQTFPKHSGYLGSQVKDSDAADAAQAECAEQEHPCGIDARLSVNSASVIQPGPSEAKPAEVATAAAAAVTAERPTDFANSQEQTVPFACHLCGLTELCHYKGMRPGFTRSVQPVEPSYVMRDPFAPRGAGQLLLLGSDCALCGRAVCQDAGCSVFFTRRFCRPCAKQRADEFPTQLRPKIT